MAEQAKLSFWKSPALPFVELRQARDSHACFQPHSHDEFSFGVTGGRADYMNMGRRRTIDGGSLVTINPGEAHACNPVGEAWSYRMLFIDTGWVAAWQQVVIGTGGMDYRGFEKQASDSPRLRHAFHRLFEGLADETDPLAAECRLMEALDTEFGILMRPAGERPILKSRNTAALERARDLLQDRVSDPVSLDELSDAAGLSRYHLVRAFKKRFGQTPHNFQMDQRIKRGKQLLQDGSSILEAALSLGFADQSHFQRAFKTRLAVTPGQYQAFFQQRPLVQPH